MNVPDVRFTENFRLHEFLKSANHQNLILSLRPSSYQRSSLDLLCQSVLQPLRDRWGRFDVTSGFRSPELNAAVGGEEDSDHLIGGASDGFPTVAKIKRVYRWIVRKNLPYRQCIFYPDRGIIHLSINLPGRRYKHDHWIRKG